ncbi:MAG: hypothetical protein B7Z76_03870 [Acidiphilium sp. 20-67-58]|jgi:hypothetical protein|nr:MAG: hypothetical protein B7Z76_03870 [Acidiphilium sp. 20-67-58]OYV84601.1 MAG: hypothetical protein B7Z64_07445 [Acidiphilium sp. 21-68-69]
MAPEMMPALAEMSMFGIGIEPAVPMLLLAVLLTDILRRGLTRLRIDRAVWNWPLFMLSIYVCTVASLILGMRQL